MFNESEQEFKIQKDYFRNTKQLFLDLEYKIGFGREATESCSLCIQSNKRI